MSLSVSNESLKGNEKKIQNTRTPETYRLLCSSIKTGFCEVMPKQKIGILENLKDRG